MLDTNHDDLQKKGHIMANIFDYLAWRGDLTLAQSEFCEVDGIILARFSYFPFEYIAQIKNYTVSQPLSISEACYAMLTLSDIQNLVIEYDDLRLMSDLAESKRFGAMQIFSFENHIDVTSQTQFSAITIQLLDNQYYVAFRGTDDTLIGWKEDFNMSFICPVPSQVLAVQYLERVAKEVPGRFRIGGHSKGGNLAVYAAAFCIPFVRDRIDFIDNYDGPGFQENILQSDGYQAVQNKIHTFVPQSSIVGMLFEHGEIYHIVHSTNVGAMQHDVYSWEIQRSHFVYLETVTNSSKFLDSTLKKWIAELTTTQKEQFVDTIYHILSETNVQTWKELTENRSAHAKSILRSIGNLDENTRKIVSETLSALVRCAKSEAGKVRKNRKANS